MQSERGGVGVEVDRRGQARADGVMSHERVSHHQIPASRRATRDRGESRDGQAHADGVMSHELWSHHQIRTSRRATSDRREASRVATRQARSMRGTGRRLAREAGGAVWFCHAAVRSRLHRVRASLGGHGEVGRVAAGVPEVRLDGDREDLVDRGGLRADEAAGQVDVQGAEASAAVSYGSTSHRRAARSAHSSPPAAATREAASAGVRPVQVTPVG